MVKFCDCTYGKRQISRCNSLAVLLNFVFSRSKSRFEREIEFTASTLTHTEPTLVFIDELYHSTNPPDALRSCEIYCGQLWKKPNVVSVISTHLFELVEKADLAIQRICCPATIDKDENIRFMYSLEKGICKVSSVDTLLRVNGLL
jgi:DNA mismatch repair ATPase MutS